MADKTVNFCPVCEIERIVLPPITGMTACATSLVANHADSVVVQCSSSFAMLIILSVLYRIKRRAFPKPVG